jgi:hypothetical protein
MGKGKASNVNVAWIVLSCVVIISLILFIRIPDYYASVTTGIMTATQRPQSLVVSLSFDIEDSEDDNESISVPLILVILDRHHAKGTFFITGEAAEKSPGLVRKIREAGHEIGLHTNEHMLPIFDEAQAVLVAERYGSTFEYVWMMSYKTPGAFKRSLDANREAILKAAGNVSTVSFRSPCLVTNWGDGPEYYGVLKQSGILIDSSVMQDFSSWHSVPRGIEVREGIIGVPVTRGDDILVRDPRNIVRKMQGAGMPAVFLFHPKGFGGYELARLEAMLSEIESEYDTTYLTIAEVAGFTSA